MASETRSEDDLPRLAIEALVEEEHFEPCRACVGNGYINAGDWHERCSACRGRGQIRVIDRMRLVGASVSGDEPEAMIGPAHPHIRRGTSVICEPGRLAARPAVNCDRPAGFNAGERDAEEEAEG